MELEDTNHTASTGANWDAILNHYLCCLVAGVPESGKSYMIKFLFFYCINILKKYTYGKVFTSIGATGLEWVNGLGTVEEYSDEALITFLDYQEKYPQPAFLYFADCAAEVPWNSKLLRSLINKYRKWHLDVFVDTQWINLVGTVLKANQNLAFIWARGMPEIALDAAWENFGASIPQFGQKNGKKLWNDWLLGTQEGTYECAVRIYVDKTRHPQTMYTTAPSDIDDEDFVLDLAPPVEPADNAEDPDWVWMLRPVDGEDGRRNLLDRLGVKPREKPPKRKEPEPAEEDAQDAPLARSEDDDQSKPSKKKHKKKTTTCSGSGSGTSNAGSRRRCCHHDP